MDLENHHRLAEAMRLAKLELRRQETAARRWTSSRIDETEVAFNIFSRLLSSDGIRAALYSLLRRTDYRYIAIFRFRAGQATSVVYVDRQNLNDLQAGEVPDTATYCCFVRERNEPFVTADAVYDSRTVGHVAREVIRAYCGVPLVTPEGGFVGTLCHYDVEPRDPEQLDPELLMRAASALVKSGQIPPYPTLAEG